MIFIGDVHGKFSQYKSLIKNVTNTIQVGDMGVGFRRQSDPDNPRWYSNPPYDKMVEGNHRFIRGNHDNPAVCKNHRQWIPDGTIEGGVMFIGGAVSIDREYRTEGYTYWSDEELSQIELDKLVVEYQTAKPRVMVTHDCPEEIAALMQAYSGRQKLNPRGASRSRIAFQRMLTSHSPEVWVFGHWHKSLDNIIAGTRFVCLSELEMKELP